VPPEDAAAFNRIFGLLQTRYYQEVPGGELFDWALKGLAAGTGDPYTTYLTPEEMQEFQEAATGNYVGIGVSVNEDEDNLLTIVEIFPDSPALAAGLMVGDKVVGVDGEDVTAITESTLVINRIKGDAGTEVTVTVYRPKLEDTLDFTMKRATINVPNITAKMLEEQVAYIRLSRFDADIARSFAQSWNQLHGEGATSLVIDLRFNPGGDYGQVVSIADMLLPEGLIVYTEDRGGRREEERSDANFLDVPMVVLVNEYSASASEILAAALQDYDHAVVVGQKTFGKGLVQTIDTGFDNGAGFKYTISTYYSPGGRNIQGEGVTPDIEVVLEEALAATPLANIPEDQDNQLQTALAELRRMRSAE
jgi:carboxyl-terminal processing protease